jgi:prepilin-type N-terminal cleavage/methylation domain-containing protein
MNRLNKNQSGFGAIELILVLVIVALISGVGYFVYQSKKNTDKTLASTSSSEGTPQKSTTTKPTTTNTSQSNSASYLVIKEWGVEIPLTTDIKDAYYAKLKNDTFSEENYAIGTKSLTELDANCAAENLSVSIILRQTVLEHDANAKKNDPMNSPVYTIKIGNYYYGYDRSRAACSANKNANNQQAAAFNSLQEAFKGLKAVN